MPKSTILSSSVPYDVCVSSPQACLIAKLPRLSEIAVHMITSVGDRANDSSISSLPKHCLNWCYDVYHCDGLLVVVVRASGRTSVSVHFTSKHVYVYTLRVVLC